MGNTQNKSLIYNKEENDKVFENQTNCRRNPRKTRTLVGGMYDLQNEGP